MKTQIIGWIGPACWRAMPSAAPLSANDNKATLDNGVNKWCRMRHPTHDGDRPQRVAAAACWPSSRCAAWSAHR